MARNSERYQSILIESARLFRERGYLATSIRDIGEALGITSAALYYHFKNKDELLQEVMLISLDRVRSAVEKAIAAESNPAQHILVAMKAHLKISVEYQDFAIVLLQEVRHLKPEARERVIARRDAYEAIWAQLFIRSQEVGLYKEDVDIRLLRLLTFGAINLVVTWYRDGGAFSAEYIAESLFRYATEGVISPEMLSLIRPSNTE